MFVLWHCAGRKPASWTWVWASVCHERLGHTARHLPGGASHLTLAKNHSARKKKASDSQRANMCRAWRDLLFSLRTVSCCAHFFSIRRRNSVCHKQHNRVRACVILFNAPPTPQNTQTTAQTKVWCNATQPLCLPARVQTATLMCTAQSKCQTRILC